MAAQAAAKGAPPRGPTPVHYVVGRAGTTGQCFSYVSSPHRLSSTRCRGRNPTAPLRTKSYTSLPTRLGLSLRSNLSPGAVQGILLQRLGAATQHGVTHPQRQKDGGITVTLMGISKKKKTTVLGKFGKTWKSAQNTSRP